MLEIEKEWEEKRREEKVRGYNDYDWHEGNYNF